MTTHVRLLEMLARINPSIWDAIHPHGPAVRLGTGLDRVALNPQPLPPKEALLFAAAEVAHDIAGAAIEAEAAGTEASAGIVSRAVDGWCGTPPGRHPIPWPSPWPFPWPEPEPHPNWDTELAQLVGAITLASVAARLDDGEARAALRDGAERLTDAAIGIAPVAPAAL